MSERDATRCHDCAARPGEPHVEGCDTEVCALCGGQRISCACNAEAQAKAPRLPWDGEWPGAAACREFGFWCRWASGGANFPNAPKGWVRCDKEHPDAREDLNRLHAEATWDPLKCRWVMARNN